jgi:signal transduction histidine kinase
MPGGGAVQVEVGSAGDAVHVTVADEGPGIRPEDAAHLFDPFYTTKPKGTGLGLAICRRIAEAHGGRIAVDPPVGRGARLRVELPAPPGPAAPAAQRTAEDPLQFARGGRPAPRGAGLGNGARP